MVVNDFEVKIFTLWNLSISFVVSFTAFKLDFCPPNIFFFLTV